MTKTCHNGDQGMTTDIDQLRLVFFFLPQSQPQPAWTAPLRHWTRSYDQLELFDQWSKERFTAIFNGPIFAS